MPTPEQMARELAERLGLLDGSGPLFDQDGELINTDMRCLFDPGSLDHMRIIEDAMSAEQQLAYSSRVLDELRMMPMELAWKCLTAPPELRLRAAYEVVCNVGGNDMSETARD